MITRKQKDVLKKIVELTPKDGNPPTLEKIRVALRYKSISSVQRHAEALKKKGYIAPNTRGLSLHTIEDINPPLSLSAKHVDQLTPSSAVDLFRSLLWAEARRIGIPINKIKISLWIDIPDGGIDASISSDHVRNIMKSGLVKPGTTGYQIKTGSFKPWQASAIKKELFGGKKPNRDNLGESIRACLDANGRYVLVCFGKELTDKQYREAEKLLINNLKQCGYKQPEVEVWGQSTLAGFIQIFPPLVSRLKGLDESIFQIYSSWAQQDDMRNIFEPGEKQEKLIQNIREDLRQATRATHIRLYGEPGIGKTRLIFEATKAEDLQSLTIYLDTPTKFRDSNLLRNLMEDNHSTIILVIDDCDPESSSYIWNKLKHLGSRVKMISIYNEKDDSSGTTTYFDAPPLENEQISLIIQRYGVQKDQASRWAELCGGSPRVAHVIGWNLKNNPDDILKPLDTVNIWDRYIVGRDDPQSQEVRQRKLALQYIALFKMFGFGKPVSKETEAIAALLMRDDPLLTLPRFRQIIQDLRKKKILQGESTLYISPRALHVKLWRDWWNIQGDSFEFEDFSKKIPSSLQEWFNEMFAYAAGSEAALKVVEELLGENGLFQKNDFLKTKPGSEFFLALTEAAPEAALACLKKTIGTQSKEELYQLE
ncbi:hypothetical protein IID24_05455, partial [Patescibacteria group bacterium]|nr:hypothetical protein [Patescibacteria group bacterium]